MSNTTEQATKCRRCHRVLRSATSCVLGIGPRCAAIEAAFDGLSDKQADKARQLIIDGGVTRTSRKGIARVPSDETGEHYITSVTGHCTCACGIRRKSATAKTCYHVAVVVLEFTPRRPARAARFILAA
jgi:Ni,Fe-hydrogenase III small subunit